MLTYPTGNTIPLSLLLDDGATGLYPQGKIYTLGSAVVVATVNLADIGAGRYESSWVAGATGSYTIVYVVYTDVGHTLISANYSRESEQIDVVATSATEDASLTRKILQNRLELAEGSVDNWILYDDDDITPLLQWDVKGKSGEAIIILPSTPARRIPS